MIYHLRISSLIEFSPFFIVGNILQYTIAILGYAEEDQTTILELTYNYGVTEYTKGNAYAQVT